MTYAGLHRLTKAASLRPAFKGRAANWSRGAAVASALLVGVSSPAGANDFGGLIGGVIGGMMSAQPRPQYYAPPQPQYYAPPPQQQYYPQPQYSQPQHYPRQQDPVASETRRRNQAQEAEARRQKAEKDKADKEAAAKAQTAPATAPVGDASGPIDVVMNRKGGNLWVSAEINKVVTIDFVIDSGASDITLPRDVYMTLIRSGTLTKANYIGTAQFGIADGSEVKGVKFKLASLKVGNQTLTDVVASVMPSDTATPLLGLSSLSRFQSWAIDNNSGTLKLTPIPGSNPAARAPTQVAAAAPSTTVTPQPLPDLTAVEAPTAKTGVATALAAAQPTTPAPEARVAASVPMPDAPRSGHVTSSALIVRENSTPAAAPTAAAPVAAPKAETAPIVPVFPANTAYAAARSSLMALGYGPATLPDAGKCDSNTDSTCFPERAVCAKSDSIQCDFLWRRGDQLIKVKTVAIPPTVSAVECEVNCK